MRQPRYHWLVRIRRGFGRIKDSLWFIPSLMTVASVGMFLITNAIDATQLDIYPTPANTIRFLIFAGSPGAARSLLATIATGYAAILGVVFSISLVTIQLTTSQYTTQVLSQFEKDNFNQLTLGSFVSIVVYSLLVLKTVEAGEGELPVFVPVMGVNLAIVFAIFSLFLLVLFLANLISFSRPSHFIDYITRTAITSIPVTLAPKQRTWLKYLEPSQDRLGQKELESAARAGFDGGTIGKSHSREVKATRSGFIVALYWEDLLGALREYLQDWLRSHHSHTEDNGDQWRLLLKKGIGDSVLKGDVLAVLEASLSEREQRLLARWIQQAYHVEKERKPEGDVEYALIILGGMGEKSAEIDADPQIAVQCLDGIFAILGEVSSAPKMAQHLLLHSDGGAVLIERSPVNLFDVAVMTWTQVVDAALDKELGIVPREMGVRATAILLQEARAERTETVEQLLTSLTPLYRRCLETLPVTRFLKPLMAELISLGQVLASEKRETEAKLVAKTLDDLRPTARKRPEVADLIREALQK